MIRAGAAPSRLVLVLSADGLETPGEEFPKGGSFHRLRKPLSRPRIVSALAAALGDAAPVTTAAPSTPGETGQRPIGPTKRRILLAEDNIVNQQIGRVRLTRAGHVVTLAATGLEVLARLAEQEFDAVLMDVQMPEMDGLQATQEIRRREQGTSRHLPIIALTAHAMRGDAERCLEAGMDAHLAKPVNWQEVDALLDRLLLGEQFAARSP